MFKFIKNRNKTEVLDIILFGGISLISIILSILNFLSIINLTEKQILDLVLICMGLAIGSNVIERYGILEKILNKDSYYKKHNIVELLSRMELERTFTLERLENATEIFFITYSGTTLWHPASLIYFENAIRNRNTKFKIIIINPNSESAKEIIKNKVKNAPHEHIKYGHDTLKNIMQSNQLFISNVEVRKTDINIVNGMMISKTNNKLEYIKIDLFGIEVSDKTRRSFIIQPDDIDNTNYYLNQWELIWGKSTPI